METEILNWALEQGPTIVILGVVLRYGARWSVAQMEGKNRELSEVHNQVANAQGSRIEALEESSRICDQDRSELHKRIHDNNESSLLRQAELLKTLGGAFEKIAEQGQG